MSDDALNKRVSDLEAWAKRTADQFELIVTSLRQITVAISGDQLNDILGVIGRLRLIDQHQEEFRKQIAIHEIEVAQLKAASARHELAVAAWNTAREQAAGAIKLGRILYGVLGAFAGALIAILTLWFQRQ